VEDYLPRPRQPDHAAARASRAHPAAFDDVLLYHTSGARAQDAAPVAQDVRRAGVSVNRQLLDLPVHSSIIMTSGGSHPITSGFAWKGDFSRDSLPILDWTGKTAKSILDVMRLKNSACACVDD
jgi:hypothetical protein